jgi:hypothetical protein
LEVRYICVALAIVALGCPDEPGKVRGRVSRGSATAEPEPRHRFVLDSGSAHFAMPVLSRVRRRLGPVGAFSASIRGEKVVVDVDGDLREKASAALGGPRLDVLADGKMLVRGESLAGATSQGDVLRLAFEGTAKTALNRAMSEGAKLAVKLDGNIVSRYESKDYEGIDGEAGELSVKLVGGRARELAEVLPGRALSHRTKLEQRVIE